MSLYVNPPKTIIDQILGSKTNEDLLAIDLADASSVEEAVIDFILKSDFLDNHLINWEPNVSLCVDENGDFCISEKDIGINSSIESIFYHEDWVKPGDIRKMKKNSSNLFYASSFKSVFKTDYLAQERL